MHWWRVLTGGWLAASSSATKLWSAHIGESITNFTKVSCALAHTYIHTICNSSIYFCTHCFSFPQNMLERERESLCVWEREGLVGKMWCLPHKDTEMCADINLSSWNGAEGRDGKGKKELKERWRGDNESRGIHITFIKHAHTHHFLKMQSDCIQYLHNKRSSPTISHSFIHSTSKHRPAPGALFC